LEPCWIKPVLGVPLFGQNMAGQDIAGQVDTVWWTDYSIVSLSNLKKYFRLTQSKTVYRVGDFRFQMVLTNFFLLKKEYFW
jgi:hypothetical protein